MWKLRPFSRNYHLWLQERWKTNDCCGDSTITVQESMFFWNDYFLVSSLWITKNLELEMSTRTIDPCGSHSELWTSRILFYFSLNSNANTFQFEAPLIRCDASSVSHGDTPLIFWEVSIPLADSTNSLNWVEDSQPPQWKWYGVQKSAIVAWTKEKYT